MPHLCEEVTATAGATAPGGPHYVLGGASSNERRPISEGMADGDRSGFVVFSAGSPMQFEVFEGEYDADTNSVKPLVVRDSSNGGSSVVWPGSGQRNIYPSAFANPLVPLTDPAAPFGMLARTSQYTYAARTFGSTAEFMGWTFPNGVTWNPTLAHTYLPLRRNAFGTEAQRTMAEELVLTALSTKFLGASHKWRGNAADIGLLLTRIGAQNYKGEIEVSGFPQQILTNADRLVGLYPDIDTTTGAVADGTVILSVNVPVPATPPGAPVIPYKIAVHCDVRGAVGIDGTGGSNVTATLREIVGGSPTIADVNLIEMTRGSPGSDGSHAKKGSIPLSHIQAAAMPGSTYTYTVAVSFGTGGALALQVGGHHNLEARLYSRAA